MQHRKQHWEIDKTGPTANGCGEDDLVGDLSAGWFQSGQVGDAIVPLALCLVSGWRFFVPLFMDISYALLSP